MSKRTSDDGIEFITGFEGEILHVYDDGFGYPTAGVGHLLTESEKEQFPLKTKITKQQSRDWLKQDLGKAEAAINSAVTVPITQNQFDAMVSLAFNIGNGGFTRSSLLRNLNNRKYAAAADAFLSWNKARGKPVAGLTRRRKAERELFLTPDPAAAASDDPVETTSKGDSVPSGELPTVQPPTIETSVVTAPAIKVEQAVPAIEQPDLITRINTRFTALGTSAVAALAALWAAVKDMKAEIIIALIITSGVILLVYVVLTKLEKISANKQEQETKRQREAQAHELTVLQANSQARKDLNAVVIVPTPLQNSDPVVDPINQV